MWLSRSTAETVIGGPCLEHNEAVTIPTGPRHRMSRAETRGGVPAPRPDQSPPPRDDTDLERLLALVARGDQDAFETLYDRLSGPAFGLVRKVLRDPAQSEEVTQEVMLEVWRSASRFDPARGSATTWALTIAHRRAVDRVRSETASAEREQRSAAFPFSVDDVAETVEASMDAEQVRRCLEGLTEIQREAITLAYYGGYTYPQVAKKLEVALGTVKTRIRDGLMRLGNCLGRSW
jgi:RNA polymerase sigma-70 factor, ECF subfamily